MTNFSLLVTLLGIVGLVQGRIMSLERGEAFADSLDLQGINNQQLRGLLSSSSRNTRDSFCSEPVAKGKVSFPDSIVGRGKVDFDMYSGYVNVTTAPDYLFYWFFSTRDQNPNAPLIVWTNGGPGCTAMEGATTENGPLFLLDIKEACSGSKCDYTGQFSANPYAWNAHANVLYLDQPRNVGYRYCNE
jgi:carboxypeptidase C (cathepsin A)